MFQRLNQQGLNVDGLKSSDSTQLGVKAAFNLSWLKLDKQTQLVGKLLSLFAPDVIPWKLVESVSQELNWNSNDVGEARKQLYKFNLIQLVSSQDGFYRVHVLIRDFFNSELGASEEIAKDFKGAFVGVMLSIAQEIPEIPTRSDIESVEDAIPHLKEVAESLITTVRDEDLVWTFLGIARFYEGQGLYTLAEPWYEQCLSTTKERLGEEHIYVAASLDNLALLYVSLCEYKQAQPLFLQALELTKKLLGEEHPFVATSLNNLAELYYSQGEYEKAEPLYLEALELRKNLLGQEHSDVAVSLNNLAGLYFSQGRYKQTELLYLQALELTKKQLGKEHPFVAIGFNNLALLYHSQGRYEEAETLYLQALEIAEQKLGLSHPDTVTIRKNLQHFHNKRQSSSTYHKPWYLKPSAFIVYFLIFFLAVLISDFV